LQIILKEKLFEHVKPKPLLQAKPLLFAALPLLFSIGSASNPLYFLYCNTNLNFYKKFNAFYKNINM
jgi:hypothetical protein